MYMMNGTVIGGIITAIVVVLFFICSYIKASPDEALIVSGLRKKPRVYIGKAGLRIPFLERKDVLNLRLIPIDVKTSSSVPTADFINILVDSVVNVKISDKKVTLKEVDETTTDIDMIIAAAQNFLNKDSEYIGKVAREVLEGNMREIVGKMTLQEMVNDRQKFAELVKENAGPDLARMGLDIVSFNVQNFIDNNKVIENLGVDNITKIQKSAAIARAEAERDIAVAQAKAKKESNDAQIDSETQIATKQNEYALKKAELDTAENTAKAKADAAYSIQEQEQRKTVEIATANANLAKQEKEIELKKRDVEITEQSLEASVKKQAEAEKYATQQKADAELYERTKAAEAKLAEIQRQADAQKYQQEQEAIAIEKMAEAQKQKMIAEAEGIKAKGEAEAAAIQAKALAEAEGTLKKAEAMKEYGNAAKMQMQLETIQTLFNNMPAIAESIAKPLASVDSITMYGDGNVAKMTEDITKSTRQISDGLLGGLGVDLKSLVGGVLGSLGGITSDDATDKSSK